MKTIIKDEESTLEITDDGFDSPIMWLKLSINGESIDVPLRTLMGTIIGFDAKKERFYNDQN